VPYENSLLTFPCSTSPYGVNTLLEYFSFNFRPFPPEPQGDFAIFFPLLDSRPILSLYILAVGVGPSRFSSWMLLLFSLVLVRIIPSGPHRKPLTCFISPVAPVFFPFPSFPPRPYGLFFSSPLSSIDTPRRLLLTHNPEISTRPSPPPRKFPCLLFPPPTPFFFRFGLSLRHYNSKLVNGRDRLVVGSDDDLSFFLFLDASFGFLFEFINLFGPIQNLRPKLLLPCDPFPTPLSSVPFNKLRRFLPPSRNLFIVFLPSKRFLGTSLLFASGRLFYISFS